MKAKTAKYIERCSWIAGILAAIIGVMVWAFGDNVLGEDKANQRMENGRTHNTQVVSNTTNVQTDDHRSRSPILNSNAIWNGGTLNIGGEQNSRNDEKNSRNRINTGGGDVTFGDKNSGNGSGNKVSNRDGKVIINGEDRPLNFTGSNSGLIINGNSNSTVINVWMNESPFKFASNGTFNFPPGPSGKMAELRQLAQTEEFKQALRPFAALGTYQPEKAGNIFRLRQDRKTTVPRPISYSKLVEGGALQADTASQERLVKMAVSEDPMRPRWFRTGSSAKSWASNPEYNRMVQNAQKWINTYHEEMIQLGMLSE